MTIRTQRLTLELEIPFTISYGTSTVRHNVLVYISDGEFTGVGEAAVVPYYNETPERILNDFATLEGREFDPLLLEDMLDGLPLFQSNAARAAVDIALHDLWGQRLGRPLYQLWGLNPARCPISSFTVSLPESDEDYLTRLRAARDYPVIKLKLGSGSWEQDLHYVEIARQELGNAQIAVDANGGWDAESALAIIPTLSEMGLLFIEQPVARHDWDGWRILHDTLPENRPPLIADESVQGVDSIPAIAQVVDGINIKLAKCGGLRPARQIITLARALNLKILLGCMVESSVAVTAAAQLAPLVDYTDLDGNILITNDPYRGVANINGQLTLPTGPGLGVTPVAN